MIDKSLRRIGRLREPSGAEEPAAASPTWSDQVQLASDAQDRRDWQEAHDH